MTREQINSFSFIVSDVSRMGIFKDDDLIKLLVEASARKGYITNNMGHVIASECVIIFFYDWAKGRVKDGPMTNHFKKKNQTHEDYADFADSLPYVRPDLFGDKEGARLNDIGECIYKAFDTGTKYHSSRSARLDHAKNRNSLSGPWFYKWAEAVESGDPARWFLIDRLNRLNLALRHETTNANAEKKKAMIALYEAIKNLLNTEGVAEAVPAELFTKLRNIANTCSCKSYAEAMRDGDIVLDV